MSIGFKQDYHSQITDLTNKVMPVVYSTVLTNPANAVTISTNNLGGAFSLARAQINIMVPAGCSAPTGTSVTVNGRVNDIASGYVDQNQGSESVAQFFMGGVRNVWSQVTADLNILGGASLIGKSSYYYSDGSFRFGAVYSFGLPSGIAAITKLYFFLSGGYTLPVGTVIELRGSAI